MICLFGCKNGICPRYGKEIITKIFVDTSYIAFSFRSESWMTQDFLPLNPFGGWIKLYDHYTNHHELEQDVAQHLLLISQFVTRQQIYDHIQSEIRY